MALEYANAVEDEQEEQTEATPQGFVAENADPQPAEGAEQEQDWESDSEDEDDEDEPETDSDEA